MRMTTVDPGEVYCGVAWWESDPHWRPTSCMTFTPEECIDRLWRQWDTDYPPDLVVVEEYRIRPGEGNDWSTCPTIEVIGALRHKARQRGIPFETKTSRILVPTAARLRRRGIELLPGTDHTASAQLHGWHRILNPANGLLHQVR